ncbi:MAG TPA: DUF255 domain-containing protein [Puia sp.]|nr:DUF255 domain-containing protein [Puia sp.]
MNKLKPCFGVTALLLVVLATGMWAWRPLRAGERVRGAGVKEAGAPDEVVARAPLRRQEISWMSVDEAAGKLQKEQRPVLIDLYTTWCGWCKQMDKKTYSNKQVAQYLQDKFYPVKVDAETHATINWNGRAYQFNPSYRSNEFALYLTHGRLEFPTTIIIPPGGEPQAIPGYMEPKELELLVKYFGEGKFGKVSFDEYEKGFKPSW